MQPGCGGTPQPGCSSGGRASAILESVQLDLAPFLLVSALVIVTPGPDTAVITKHILFGGRRAGMFASLGVVTGLTVWSFAAAAGVAALLRASETALLALRIAGALYLASLGPQLLRRAGR